MKRATTATTITPVLFTNRKILDRRAGHHLNGISYSAYAVNDFISQIQNIIQVQEDSTDIVISDEALRCRWEELCNTLSSVQRADLIALIKHF